MCACYIPRQNLSVRFTRVFVKERISIEWLRVGLKLCRRLGLEISPKLAVLFFSYTGEMSGNSDFSALHDQASCFVR